MKNQKKVWDEIAPEWHEYKKLPAQHAKAFLDKQTGKVLDFGSGSGRYLMKIKKGKMYLQDFSSEMIRLAKEKAKELNVEAEFNVSEMSKLPYKNDFFDGAICISSLHCVDSEEKRKQAVKELYRVLTPGAEAFIAVWNKDSKRFKKLKTKEKFLGWQDKGKRYYYFYEEDEVHDLFKKVGFEIIGNYNSEMMIRFVVKKPNY